MHFVTAGFRSLAIARDREYQRFIFFSHFLRSVSSNGILSAARSASGRRADLLQPKDNSMPLGAVVRVIDYRIEMESQNG